MSKKWKMYKFILYESSLLTWYADVKHKKPDGMVLLKVNFVDVYSFSEDSFRMLNDLSAWVRIQGKTETESSHSLYHWFRFLPDFPHLDDECDQVALIAFPQTIKDRDRDIIWLLCEDVDDLK